MEFSISRKSLRQGLDHVRSAAARKSTMPILTGVDVLAEGEELRFFTNDGSIIATARVPATVTREGSVVVSVRELADIAKHLPDEPIVVTVGDDLVMEILCGQVKHKLTGHPSTDFPMLPVRASEALSEFFDVELLRELISCVQYAISKDADWHPETNVALFEGDGETVRMVATDGQRLSKVESKVHGRNLHFQVSLPEKSVRELASLLEGAKTSLKKSWQPPLVEMALENGLVFFRREKEELIVKLPGTTFPDYLRAIPRALERKATVSRSLFINALKRATEGKANRSHIGRAEVRLIWNADKLTVSSTSPTADSSTELAVVYEGLPLTIGLDGTYLLDALGPLRSDEITVELSDALGPILIRPVQEHSYIEFLGVVMPMRIE